MLLSLLAMPNKNAIEPRWFTDSKYETYVDVLRGLSILAAIVSFIFGIVIFESGRRDIPNAQFSYTSTNGLSTNLKRIETESPSRTIHLTGVKNTLHQSLDGMISTVDLSVNPDAFTKVYHRTLVNGSSSIMNDNYAAIAEMLTHSDMCNLHSERVVISDFTHESFADKTHLKTIKWETLTYGNHSVKSPAKMETNTIKWIQVCGMEAPLTTLENVYEAIDIHKFKEVDPSKKDAIKRYVKALILKTKICQSMNLHESIHYHGTDGKHMMWVSTFAQEGCVLSEPQNLWATQNTAIWGLFGSYYPRELMGVILFLLSLWFLGVLERVHDLQTVNRFAVETKTETPETPYNVPTWIFVVGNVVVLATWISMIAMRDVKSIVPVKWKSYMKLDGTVDTQNAYMERISTSSIIFLSVLSWLIIVAIYRFILKSSSHIMTMSIVFVKDLRGEMNEEEYTTEEWAANEAARDHGIIKAQIGHVTTDMTWNLQSFGMKTPKLNTDFMRKTDFMHIHEKLEFVDALKVYKLLKMDVDNVFQLMVWPLFLVTVFLSQNNYTYDVIAQAVILGVFAFYLLELFADVYIRFTKVIKMTEDDNPNRTIDTFVFGLVMAIFILLKIWIMITITRTIIDTRRFDSTVSFNSSADELKAHYMQLNPHQLVAWGLSTSLLAFVLKIGGLVYFKKDNVTEYIMWKYCITAFTWIVFIVLFSIAYAQHFGDDIPLRTLGGLGTHIDHGPYGTRLRAINAGYQYEL